MRKKIAKKKPSGAKGSPKVANMAPNGPQNHPKIDPKSRLFRSRSKMWFCAPLPHGIDGFRGPRRPESEENPMKNRACEQTPSKASFFSLLGLPGRPKGPKRLPEGCPKGSQRDPKMEPEWSQNRLRKRLGTPGWPNDPQGHQNDSKMTSNDIEIPRK